MNNWRLLLLAVIAILQPIPSFTERNIIDGRQECCDHRSNSVIPDTRLHGTYRKTGLEERHISTREEIRRVRYEPRLDLLTRSRERLSLERPQNRFSKAAARFDENRFAKEHERLHRILFEDRKSDSILNRNDQSRRPRERISKSQYERDVLDSNRIRMSREKTTSAHMGKLRLYRTSLNSEAPGRERSNDESRRILSTKETREDVALVLDHRHSKFNTLIFESRSHQDKRERQALDEPTRNKIKQSRVLQSLDSRVNRINERDDFRSHHVSRDNRHSYFRVISLRVAERRQQNRNGEIRDITNTNHRYISNEKITLSEHRDIKQRVEQARGEKIRQYQSKIIDIQRQPRNEKPVFDSTSFQYSLDGQNLADRKEASIVLAGESRSLKTGTRPERMSRSNGKVNDQQVVFTRNLRTARYTTAELRQNSRYSQLLLITTTTNPNERIAGINERRDIRRQSSVRSPNNIAVLVEDRGSESLEHERSHERRISDERVSKYRRDIKSVERFNELQRQSQSRNSRDNTIVMRRESRKSIEIRQDIRNASPSHLKVHSEQESKIRRYLATNRRIDVLRHERKEYQSSTEQIFYHIEYDTEKRVDRDATRIFEYSERFSSISRVSRNSNIDQGTDRHNIRKDVRQANWETSRVVRNRGHRDIGDNERREVRNERDQTRASRDRIIAARMSTIRSEEHDQGEHTVRSGSDKRVKVMVRNEGFVHRDENRISERQVDTRYFKAREARRESRRMTEREILTTRHNLAMERMNRIENHVSRNIRLVTKIRSPDAIIENDMHVDNINREIRFRNLPKPANVRDIALVEEVAETDNAVNWQMLFYSLQGAYICGILMQMLNEKPKKEKFRNFAWWTSKNLVKVD